MNIPIETDEAKCYWRHDIWRKRNNQSEDDSDVTTYEDKALTNGRWEQRHVNTVLC